MQGRAILLANLGSPDSPTEPAVRRYLNQFLMDRQVIQLPWLLRRLIVSLLVLPKRPKTSAAAYRSIWWPDGSPLVVLSQRLQQGLQARTKMPVFMAMRYGKPSLESALQEISDRSGINEVLLMPLYPHFADSTVTTSVHRVRGWIDANNPDLSLKLLPPFYADPDYIEALVSVARPFLELAHDHVLFSYHGLPESHLKSADASGAHCLAAADCCQFASPAHSTCYRHQVIRTTECFAQSAGLRPDQYSISFQSRLGRAKWLEPNTERTIEELAAKGIKHLLVICPAFVTDCLETLEEIGIRARAAFCQAGGESLQLAPCLNDSPVWIEVLAKWVERSDLPDCD